MLTFRIAHFSDKTGGKQLLHFIVDGLVSLWVKGPLLVDYWLMLRVYALLVTHHRWINPGHVLMRLGEDILVFPKELLQFRSNLWPKSCSELDYSLWVLVIKVVMDEVLNRLCLDFFFGHTRIQVTQWLDFTIGGDDLIDLKMVVTTAGRGPLWHTLFTAST